MVPVFLRIRGLPHRAGVHVDVITSNLNGVAGDSGCQIAGHFPGSYVESPTVPGTGNRVSLKQALTERAPTVKAGIADGVKLASYVGDGDGRSFQGYFADLTRS
jgi:hypothetical protein